MAGKAVNEVTFIKVIEKINAIDVDAIQVVTDKRISTYDTYIVRDFLKSLGLSNRMVSVTSGYSMEVSLPSWNYYVERGIPLYDWREYNKQVPANGAEQAADFEKDSRYRTMRHEAARKLNNILLTAFPNCDDRSDSMTDYYNYVFNIWS